MYIKEYATQLFNHLKTPEDQRSEWDWEVLYMIKDDLEEEMKEFPPKTEEERRVFKIANELLTKI